MHDSFLLLVSFLYNQLGIWLKLSESECTVDVRKSILIRKIPKVNKFSVNGIKDIGEFFRV